MGVWGTVSYAFSESALSIYCFGHRDVNAARKCLAMEQTRNGLDPLSREASPLDTTHTRETGARANSVPDDQEELVQRLLCRVEDLYEQIGTPYLRPAAPRR